MDLKWSPRKAFENMQSEVPAWFIGSERDADLEGFHGQEPIALLHNAFPKLLVVAMVPKAGHMVQLERSQEVNQLLVEYLAEIHTLAD